MTNDTADQHPAGPSAADTRPDTNTPDGGGREKSGSRLDRAYAAGAVLSPPGSPQGGRADDLSTPNDADRIIAFAKTAGIALEPWQERALVAILTSDGLIRLDRGRRGSKSGGRTAPRSRPGTPGSADVGVRFEAGKTDGVWLDAIPTLPEHLQPNPALGNIVVNVGGTSPTPRDVAAVTRAIRSRRVER